MMNMATSRKVPCIALLFLSSLLVLGRFPLVAWGFAIPRPTTQRATGLGMSSGGGETHNVETSAEMEEENVKSRTQRIMEKTSSAGQTGGAGGSSTWEAFVKAEELWQRFRYSEAFEWDVTNLNPNQYRPEGAPPPSNFVTSDGTLGNAQAWSKLRQVRASSSFNAKPTLDYDVLICGGTLGIFVATALLLRDGSTKRVGVVEAGRIQGREQEWNISQRELMELVELGVLTQQDVNDAVTTEFPGCRSGFKNQEVTPLTGGYFENNIGYECFTPNVLNLGVAPSILLERVKQRFLQAGGVLLEQTRITGIVISESTGAALSTAEDEILTTRLVLDCMGNASPISRQQRYGMKPDGVCIVVGSCAAGFEPSTNVVGDIIYTNTEMQNKGQEGGQLQYFWEAFPVGIGGLHGKEPGTSDVKTTYMFTYLDAERNRPTLSTLMEDYWDLLPMYQPSISNVETDLNVKRVLFAFFPTYRDSPLQPQWSRILAIGDASGIQSPLSFGGFGALTRHLGRLTNAITDALDHDCLHRTDLAAINPYTPNLSATWMFQKAMSVRLPSNQLTHATAPLQDSKFVNRLLATNFQIMNDMGPSTITPFLQDVVRLDGLLGSLSRAFVADPTFMPQIIAHVGIFNLVDWMGHVGMMAWYTLLHNVVSPIWGPLVEETTSKPRELFHWRRRMEAWKFGSGSDYEF